MKETKKIKDNVNKKQLWNSALIPATQALAKA